MKRIDVVRNFIENDSTLYDEVCPHCYHLLDAMIDEEEGVGNYLYCPNEQCRNNEHFPFVYNIRYYMDRGIPVEKH